MIYIEIILLITLSGLVACINASVIDGTGKGYDSKIIIRNTTGKLVLE